MRVLHLVRPAGGGMLRFLQRALPLLEEVTVEVAAPHAMHEALAPWATRRWEITDRPQWWSDLRCAYQAYQWQRLYSLFHAHGLRATAVLSLLPPRRWVFSLHNLLPDRLSPLQRSILRRAAQTASAVLPVSQAILRQWLALFPDTEPRCFVVTGGVDEPPNLPDRSIARAQLGIPEGVPTLLCVARLMHDKGIDILVQALAMTSQWFALIVGEGPDRAELEALCQHLRLEKRLRFTGYLPDLSAVWAACDVAVVPSRREGLGLFALEALAAGKPVVASRVGGLPEVVVPGETGWLVPPEDPQALAQALQYALQQCEQWSLMGQKGKADVKNRFSWHQTARRLQQVYRRVVST